MNARFIIHVPSRDIKPISPLPQEGSWKTLTVKSLCPRVRDPMTCLLCFGAQKRVWDSSRLPELRGIQGHFERTLGFCLVVPPDVQWRQHSFQFLRALDNRLSFISRLFLKNQILVSPFVSLSLSAMAARVPSLVFLKVLFLLPGTAHRWTQSIHPSRTDPELSPSQLLLSLLQLTWVLFFKIP